MSDPTTEIQKMIQELNQYILPGTLMESFDAYREEAYRQALSSIPKTTVAWFLDMLNRFRGPDDRKESLLEVFDPCIFTVNHPAWESPPGTVIDLPALTSEVATNAKRDSEIAEIAREKVRQFREHADTYDDEELMQLGSIAIAGLADQERTFQNRGAVLRYLALNASTEWKICGPPTTPTGSRLPPATSSFRIWWHDGESSCCEEKARQHSRSKTSHAIRTTKYGRSPWTCGAFFCTTAPRHLVICSRCKTRLGSWTKLLRDFDKNTILHQRRPDA